MNLRDYLPELFPARRPDLSERYAMICLREAVRHICRETLRYRGTLTLGVTNSSFVMGAYNESFIRPSAEDLTDLVLPDQEAETENKKLSSLRVLGCYLMNTTTGRVLRPVPVDIGSLRTEALRLVGLITSGQDPKYCADAQGALSLWPFFDQTRGWDRLVMDLAVCPMSQEFEQIALPPEVEEAVIQDALGRIFEFAGRGQNLQLAHDHRIRGANAIASCRAAAEVGTSGTPGAGRSQFGFKVRCTGGFL